MKTTTMIIKNHAQFGYMMWMARTALVAISILLCTNLQAQSGSWLGSEQYANGASVTDGSGGYKDYGNGVIQLTDNTFSGCTASAIHSKDFYNYCDSSFSKCYKVLFGCGDADGMAFSFSYGCNQNDDSWKVWGCGGGLGYRNGCAWNQGITVEFDTYNNAGDAGFDGSYAGTGNNDEIAIHKNLEATDAGKLTAVSVPDLEDGLEHNVCINYDPTTHVISVTIDGINRITYDIDDSGLNLDSYFSGCSLMTTWSAGTNAGLNYQIVSDGASIFDNTPHPGGVSSLCPQMLPVEFLNLNARAGSSSVLVSWSTGNEKSNEKFVIERSDNLTDWQTVGEVPGGGNLNSVNSYSFTDYTPLDNTSYYRLRQVDFNNSYTYSKVVVVKTVGQNIIITPNPFDDVLVINNLDRGAIDIKIHDMLGRLLYHFNKNNKNSMLEIHPDLSEGTYIITIQTESFIYNRKVIKK